jgi:hypothetical protein
MITLGIKTTYVDPATAQSVDVRISSRPYSSGGDQWLPRIVAGSDPEIRLAVDAPWSRGRVAASYGSVDVANPDGALDAWMDGIWTSQEAEVRVGYPDEAWENWTSVGIVRMEHPEYIDGRVIRLRFRDRIEDLEGAVQKHFFDGAPNSDLDGQPLPMILGLPWHVPALVYDEVSTTEIYYYVADNFYPKQGVGWVREGLAPIYEGTDPGQYQDWPNGFRLNSQPTLPITVLPSGPRLEPWPIKSTRFLEWQTVNDGTNDWEVPVNWDRIENFVAGLRYARRVSGTNHLEVVVNNATSGVVRIIHGVALEGTKSYRLNWRAVADGSYDNQLILMVRAAFSTLDGVEVLVENLGVVDFLSTTEVEFTLPDASGNDLFLCLEFRRDSLGPGLSALFESIWLEDLAAPARTLDQQVPYLVCQRGVIDGSSETGPFAYADVDHDALASTTAATGSLELAHYWQDGSTHRDLLDLLFRSTDSVWWIDRVGRVTCAPFLLTDDASVAEFDDTNRTTKIEVSPTPAKLLTDSFKYHRQFRPVPEGEAADTVNEATKAAGARDFISTRRASSSARANLHPDYRHAIGAEPDETALVGPGGTALQDRADRRLEDHSDRIQYWRVEGVLSRQEQAEIEPMKNITLYSARLGISAGKQVQVLDLRLLPVSGRVQIIARG